MISGKKKGRISGFTLMETLVTVAVIIVLLAVSMVAAVRYRDYLRITELDNTAREIYMAAQNRAVLLRNRDRLEKLVVDTDNKLSVGSNLFLYYKENSDADINELLPDGAIDPALWDGDFYVVYEPESGSVTDVFFAKKAPLSTSSFDGFYDKYRNTGKNVRMKLNPMVGYYGGDSAASGDSVTLRTPVIDISNSDTLTATVTWWLPQILRTEMDKMELEVILDYQGQKVKLSEAFKDNPDRMQEESDEGTIYITNTSTYLLDSLVQGQQFKDLGMVVNESGLSTYDEDVWNALGGDFTITAEVKYTGTERRITGAIGKAEDNSLFAKSTTEDTAYIGCMRHLQNLHPTFSGAAQYDGPVKTKAIQIADIANVQVPDPADPASGTMVDYNFVPIMNYMLTSYDGQKHEIRELYINDRDRAELSGGGSTIPCTGLFSMIYTESPFEFKGVRLINSKIWGTNVTGALCGGCFVNINISDCQVYWENSVGYSNLQHLLGSTSSGENYALDEPMIQGGEVGALVGGSQGYLAIENCLASTSMKGDSVAGGFVGYTDGGCIISHSYADCYLEGEDAAGLIGSVRSDGNRIENTYAAGFISVNNEGKAAGLYLKTKDGSGIDLSITVSNSYAAMGYSSSFNESIGGVGGSLGSEDDLRAKRYPLGDGENNTYINTYYLYSPYVNSGKKEDDWYGLSLNYEDLANETVLAKLGGNFVMKNAVGTHAYNLQDELSLSRYPYPGIEGLDHYGDWSASFQVGSLVYWEQYANESSEATEIGIEGGGVKTLRSGRKVSDDGYAVALSQMQIGENTKIEIIYQIGNEEQVTETYELKDMPAVSLMIDGSPMTYHLAKLPPELMTTEIVSETFYQKLNITLSVGVNKQTLYYYNPHFAATVIEADEELSDDALNALAKNATVRVRSPRHLYELSKHKEYYGSANNYTFLQELDLDYRVYKGYNLFGEQSSDKWSTKEKVQSPIGSSRTDTFTNIYDGGSHLIIHVPLDTSKGNYVGLFGYNSGTIRNIVYIGLTPDNNAQTFSRGVSESSTTVYAGALAGGNSGNISNSAVTSVRLELSAYHYSTVYAGGLVGINYGTITNTEVTMDGMTADGNYSDMYLGGFVGQNANGATIASCYAIGRIEASKARYGNVYACGFAGRNSGTLRNSYAAADLSVSGGAEEYGFCRDNSNNCYFLNEGNFQYCDKVFSAQYTDGGASEQTWTQMTTDAESEGGVLTSLSSAGFKMGAAAKYGNTGVSTEMFVFPGVVRDVSNGNQLVHYGPWPELTKLGALGVFYWEKEVKQGKDAYHFSAISVDTDSNSVSEMSTLCTAHDDGGVIEEYGYGYFYTGSLVEDGWKDKLANHQRTSFAVDAENEEAEKQLSSMMGGAYNFVAYTTTTAPDPDGSKTKTWLEGDVTEDIWAFTLSNEKTYQFKVNPFFADSFSYMGVEGGTTSPQVQNVELGAEEKPYGVRSVEQLRYINWYYASETLKSTNELLEESTAEKFVYLTTDGNESKKYWRQSHDLQGDPSSKYSPIAAYHDLNGTLNGWFGGGYNGADYAIHDISIFSDKASVVGLFGVTYNAEFKNIIMYSSDGNASVIGNSHVGWYAIGGLVGLAATSNNDYTISNCSVAGYTIKDEHSGNDSGDGGGGVGGLIGICNMELTDCMAVTNIEINFTYNSLSSRHVRVGGIAGSCQKKISRCYAGGKIEVGEKAGSTTNNPCIHAGGIAGGIYMKGLTGTNITISNGNGSNQNEFEKCYSYVELPALMVKNSNSKANEAGQHHHLYAIGGTADVGGGKNSDIGMTTFIDCYYLTGVVDKNTQEEGRVLLNDSETQYENEKNFKKISGAPSGISYDQMSGKELVSVKTEDNTEMKRLFLDLLNSYNGDKKFSTVTKEDPDNGSNISGKYSLSSDSKLTGMNYPFPTILTQTTASGKTVNVHYGDWPLAGIEREDGDVPVSLDIFGDEDDREAGVEEPGGTSPGGGVVYEEDNTRTLRTKEIKLTLSEILKDVAPKGTLTVTCENRENVPEDENEGAGSLPQNPGGDEPKGHVVKAQFKAPDKALVDKLEVDGTIESPYGGVYKGADAVLVISAQEQGSAVVKVSYTPDPGENGESLQVVDLEIEVNVSADLQLLPAIFEKKSEGTETPGEPSSTPELTIKKLAGEPVAFTGQPTDVDLYAFNLNDDPVSSELPGKVSALRINGVMYDTQCFSEATVKEAASGDSGAAVSDPCRRQLSVTGKELTGITAVTVEYEYDYTYTDESNAEGGGVNPTEITRTYRGTSTINTQISEFELIAEPVELYLDEEDAKMIWTCEMLQFLVDGVEKEIASESNLPGTGVPGDIGDTEDKIINPVLTSIRSGDPNVVLPEKNPDGNVTVSGRKAGRAVLIFQLQFSYKACSHTVQIFIETNVYNSRLEMTSSRGSGGITLFFGAENSGTLEYGTNTAEIDTGSEIADAADSGASGDDTGDIAKETPRSASVMALLHTDAPVTYSWELSADVQDYIDITVETETGAEAVAESAIYDAEQDVVLSAEQGLYGADTAEQDEMVIDEGTVQNSFYSEQNSEAQTTLSRAVLKLKDESAPSADVTGTLTVTAVAISTPEGGSETAGTNAWTKSINVTLVVKPTVKLIWSEDQSVFTEAGLEYTAIDGSSVGRSGTVYLAVVPDTAVKPVDVNMPAAASEIALDDAYTAEMPVYAESVAVEPDTEISVDEIMDSVEAITETEIMPMVNAGEGAADTGDVELLPKEEWSQQSSFGGYKILKAELDTAAAVWTVEWQADYVLAGQEMSVKYTEQIASDNLLHAVKQEEGVSPSQVVDQAQDDNMSSDDTPPDIVYDMDLELPDGSGQIPDDEEEFLPPEGQTDGSGGEELLPPEDETDGSGGEELLPPEGQTDGNGGEELLPPEDETDGSGGEELLPSEDETDGSGGEEIIPPETEPYTESVLLNESEQDPSSEMETMSLAEQADDADGEEFLLPETELGTEMFLSGDFGQDGEINLPAETEIYLDDLSA